jgi:hypothetical protein
MSTNFKKKIIELIYEKDIYFRGDFFNDYDITIAFLNIGHIIYYQTPYFNPLDKKDKNMMYAYINGGGNFQNLSEEMRNNFLITLKAVKMNGLNLKYASQRLRLDYNICSSAVKNNPEAIKYSSWSKNYNDILRIAISKDPIYLKYWPKNNNKISYSIVLDAVKKIAANCKYVPNIYKNDRKIAFASIRHRKPNLYYIANKFRKDFHIVLEAVKYCDENIKFASNTLKNDRKIVYESLKHTGNYLNITAKFRYDHDLLSKLLKNGTIPSLRYYTGGIEYDSALILVKNKNNFRYFPKILKDDYDIVFEAVKHGAEMRFIPLKFLEYPEILIEILKFDENLYRYLDEEIVIFHGIKFNNLNIKKILDKFHENHEILIELIKIKPEIYPYLPKNLKCVPKIAYSMMKMHKYMYDCLPNQIKNTYQMVLLYIEQGPNETFKTIVPRSLRNNQTIINHYFKYGGYDKNQINSVFINEETFKESENYKRIIRQKFPVLPNYYKSDPEFSLVAAARCENYAKIDSSLRNNYEFNLKLMQRNPQLLKCIPEKFRKDERIMIKAIKGDARNIKYYPHVDVRKIFKYNYEILLHIGEKDKNFWIEIIKEDILTFNYMPNFICKYLLNFFQ